MCVLRQRKVTYVPIIIYIVVEKLGMYIYKQSSQMCVVMDTVSSAKITY